MTQQSINRTYNIQHMAMKELADKYQKIYGQIIFRKITGGCEIYFMRYREIFICRKEGSIFTYAYFPKGKNKPSIKKVIATQFDELYGLTKSFIPQYLSVHSKQINVPANKPLKIAKSLQKQPQTTTSKNKSVSVQVQHKEHKPLQKMNILRSLGYDVSEKGRLSTFERQLILKEIIVSRKRMTKQEVINHIEWNIRMRRDNAYMKLAISKWEDDLRYIRKYL